jgi:hypothetical protein
MIDDPIMPCHCNLATADFCAEHEAKLRAFLTVSAYRALIQDNVTAEQRHAAIQQACAEPK